MLSCYRFSSGMEHFHRHKGSGTATYMRSLRWPNNRPESPSISAFGLGDLVQAQLPQQVRRTRFGCGHSSFLMRNGGGFDLWTYLKRLENDLSNISVILEHGI